MSFCDGLAALVELLGGVLPSLGPFLGICHRLLIWSAIATLISFLVCSLAIQALENFGQVWRVWKGQGKGTP